MAFWSDLGSIGSDLFSGGSGNFGDSGSSGFDWGSVWDTAGDWFGSSSGGSGGGGGGGGWLDTLQGIFTDDGDVAAGSGWGNNIFTSMLGGLAGGADAKLGLEMVKQQAKLRGAEERKTLGFAGELEDFYKQKDKSRKRAALDTYGQFSLMNRWAPTAQASSAVDVPNKPVAGQGGY